MCSALGDVCFTPESGPSRCKIEMSAKGQKEFTGGAGMASMWGNFHIEAGGLTDSLLA